MLPNFIIVGAARSGTTSLYHYLNKHPQVFMSPIKETNFFSVNHLKLSLEDYKNLFKRAVNEKAIGEASPSYLYTEETPYKIKKVIPHCKIIIILRDPAERAYSDFLSTKALGLNKGNFDEFLKKPMNDNCGKYYSLSAIIKKGMYYGHVKRYIDLFGAERININTYDDLCSAPLRLVQGIYKFLEVDASFIPNIEKRYNIGGEPIIPLLSELVVKPNIIKKFLTPLIPKKYRRALKQKLLEVNTAQKKRLCQVKQEAT